MAKKHRNLIGKICEPVNLMAAYQATARGRRGTDAYLEFKDYDHINLECLAGDMAAGAYRQGPLRNFTVYEPKPRLISALSFRDRVAQHALVNIIGPIFEAGFLRGRDNGAGNDPDGTRAPGNVQADDLKSHTHQVYTDNSTAYVAGAGAYRATSAGAAAPDASGATGGTETRPKNVTVTFCRYNGYASSDMTGCPAGFTQIAAQGRSLGCMQTAEEASTVASWNVAADTCFTKYGGRLPRSQEWYIAMNNYALTGETGNWEWLDDYATVTSPFDGHATVGSTSISDFSYERDNNTTVAYRCFIQN